MLKHINKENFQSEVIDQDRVVVVDFFATWCGPCQMLTPILEKIADTRADFDIAKIDIDDAEEVAIEYQVEVVPTLIIFKNGKEVDRVSGYLPENTLLEKISAHL